MFRDGFSEDFDVFPDQLVEPAISGYIQKLAKSGSYWNRRYCVVHNNIMYYFKDPKTRARGVVLLDNASIDHPHGESSPHFSICTRVKRSLMFQAPDMVGAICQFYLF